MFKPCCWPLTAVGPGPVGLRRVNSNTPGGLSAGQVLLVVGVVGKVPGTLGIVRWELFSVSLLPFGGFRVLLAVVAATG